jgi:type II secretion system protein C
VRERIAALAAALALATRSSVASAAQSPGVHVLGTVVSSDASRSLAVVDDGGAHRVVHVGDELGGATVAEIRSDALVLRRAGRAETLDLQSVRREVGASTPVPASPAPADPDAQPKNAPRVQPTPRTVPASRSAAARSNAARVASSGARGSAPRSASAAQTPDEMMSQLALQAQWVAVNDNSGQLRGVAVVSILPDSMLERLGLQSNDVVTSIQGVAVDSSGAALNTARGLDLSQPVTLGIERRGVATTVVVNLQHH